MKSRISLVALVAACFVLPGLWLAAQAGAGPREQIIGYLNGIAKTQLENRSRSVAGIGNSVDADRRKAEVRAKILRLIGGLPEGKGPVTVREFRKSDADGFRVERIAYESQPGFWVTGDVFVPEEGSGPFPAIVLAPGHRAGGKSENWNWGGNLRERNHGAGLRSVGQVNGCSITPPISRNLLSEIPRRARRSQHRPDADWRSTSPVTW
jgi:hypothetical protein